MELEDFLIGGFLGGLFILAMILGYTNLTSDNNAQNLLLQDQQINGSYNQFFGNLTTLQTTANDSKSAFEKESPTFTAGFLLFGSIIDFVKKMTSSFIAIFVIFFDLLGTLLGIPPIVIGVLSAIVIIILIVLAWRKYKTG